MQPESIQECAFFIWERLLNVPYRWGGDDPMEGVDCSGFVLEGLKAVGIVGRNDDYTADGLLTILFKDKVKVRDGKDLRRGMLVFWGEPVRHVEVVWAIYGDRVYTIGASGGGRKTIDRVTAIQQNAYVKIRPLVSGWRCALYPF